LPQALSGASLRSPSLRTIGVQRPCSWAEILSAPNSHLPQASPPLQAQNAHLSTRTSLPSIPPILHDTNRSNLAVPETAVVDPLIQIDIANNKKEAIKHHDEMSNEPDIIRFYTDGFGLEATTEQQLIVPRPLKRNNNTSERNHLRTSSSLNSTPSNSQSTWFLAPKHGTRNVTSTPTVNRQ